MPERTESSMFVPIGGLRAVDLLSPFTSSKETSSTYWTPRTATDIQHAATESRSPSRSKHRWQASISRFFRSPHDKHNSSNTKVLNDVEMQQHKDKDKNKDKDTQRPSRMSSLKLPKSRTRTGISDQKEKAYEKSSSMTTSATTIFSPNIGRSSTLKKRRPSHRDSSLSTLLSQRDQSMRAPSATSTLAEIQARPSTPSSSVCKDHHRSVAETNPPVRRRSTIKDWKKKADRLSLSLSVLAPSARMSPHAMPPYCKSTVEWDRLSIDEATIPKRTSVVRGAPVGKKSPEKQRNEHLSVPKTQPTSRSTSRSRPASSIDIVGDGELSRLMEEANGNTKRNGGVEALELV